MTDITIIAGLCSIASFAFGYWMANKQSRIDQLIQEQESYRKGYRKGYREGLSVPFSPLNKPVAK